jgi:uncharacterized BrkB/YihY/UPF0761 family membrane protein
MRKYFYLLFFMLSLIVPGLIINIAWEHNPQCEIHCNGVIHWDSLIPLGIGIWVVALPLALLVSGFIYIIVRGVYRFIQRQKR